MVLVVLGLPGAVKGSNSPIHTLVYVQRADIYQSGEKPSCALLKMRFPGPETTLGATLSPSPGQDFVCAKRMRPTAPLGPSYDSSITYTKAQRLTENRPGRLRRTRSFAMDEAPARNSADIPIRRADGGVEHPARRQRSTVRAILARDQARRGSGNAGTACTRSLPKPVSLP